MKRCSMEVKFWKERRENGVEISLQDIAGSKNDECLQTRFKKTQNIPREIQGYTCTH